MISLPNDNGGISIKVSSYYLSFIAFRFVTLRHWLLNDKTRVLTPFFKGSIYCCSLRSPWKISVKYCFSK